MVYIRLAILQKVRGNLGSFLDDVEIDLLGDELQLNQSSQAN